MFIYFILGVMALFFGIECLEERLKIIERKINRLTPRRKVYSYKSGKVK